MRSTPTQRWKQDSRARWLGAIASAAATVVLLAAIPTAQAGAGTDSISPVAPAEVEQILSQTPLNAIEVPALVEALEKLPGLSGLEPAVLQAALTETIEALRGEGANLGKLLNPAETAPVLEAALKEALGPLAGMLETLLGGNPVTKLTEALESSDPQKLLAELLGSAPEPQRLIAELLGALNPAALEKLLGGLPTGEPFSAKTIEELAAQLGTSLAGLAERLGANPGELPGEAIALTGPLTNGKTLGVLNTANGVTMGLITEVSEPAKGGGTGGGGGPGGGGGSGGSTGAGPGGSPPTGTAASAVGKAFKIKVLSHRVKRRIATIVVQVPSAGTLSLAGNGIRPAHKRTTQAARMTIRTALSRAGSASLRRRHRIHRRLNVPVKVSFRQPGGGSASATVPVAFG